MESDRGGARAAWYAIQSKPKQEERAEADLAAWGVEVFLPRIRRAARGRSDVGRAPLFPSYLFARFNSELMLAKVRYTRGVARVLGTEAGPTPVCDGIIALLQERVGADGTIRLSLNSGDRVRIVDGPFRDFTGVFFHAMTSGDRVRVLLAAVSGSFNVVTRMDALERIAL